MKEDINSRPIVIVCNPCIYIGDIKTYKNKRIYDMRLIDIIKTASLTHENSQHNTSNEVLELNNVNKYSLDGTLLDENEKRNLPTRRIIMAYDLQPSIFTEKRDPSIHFDTIKRNKDFVKLSYIFGYISGNVFDFNQSYMKKDSDFINLFDGKISQNENYNLETTLENIIIQREGNKISANNKDGFFIINKKEILDYI